jgi:hypothetical protein
MALDKQLAALNRLYARYDQYTRKLQIACQKYCAHCCTCNVTITSLEAANILQSLSETERTALHRALVPQLDKKRYQPKITLNQMAAMCAQGEEPPEETIDPAWGSCALLDQMACPIYAFRPFGCRCLLSIFSCEETGYAEIDDFTITVNYVFAQFIEHLDQDGQTGNLADMLIAAGLAGRQYPFVPNALSHTGQTIPNRPIPVLLIPPSHQKDITALVEELHAIISID